MFSFSSYVVHRYSKSYDYNICIPHLYLLIYMIIWFSLEGNLLVCNVPNYLQFQKTYRYITLPCNYLHFKERLVFIWVCNMQSINYLHTFFKPLFLVLIGRVPPYLLLFFTKHNSTHIQRLLKNPIIFH